MKAKLTVLFIVTLAAVGLGGAFSRSAVGAAPAVAPPPTFSGTWQTTWTATDGRVVSAPVTIKVDAGDSNALDGAVEAKGANGVMYGALTSNGKALKWSGNWWNTDGVHGTFTFTLADKTGKNFTGNYKVAGSDKEYDWHGSK